MVQPITATPKGIKCDNNECDYEDMSVDPADYPNWVNKPCPKCGSNLLTEEDFSLFKGIMEMIDNINKDPEMIKLSEESDEELVHGVIRMNGTGTASMEILGDKDKNE